MKNNNSRRHFIKNSIATGIGLPLLASSFYRCKNTTENSKKNEGQAHIKLKILILGGTSFLGPAQIAYAQERGHTISTFTRGKTIPTTHKELFKNVEQLIGDRENDLKALENRKWDVVIDNSGRKVEWTKKTATLLKDNCNLYLYTSSTGVYYPYLEKDYPEGSPLVLKVPEGVEGEMKMEYDYGVMKANSEIAVLDQFGKDRSIIVRPTYMFGPGDRTNRFTYWPIRLSQGGEVLVPGKKDDPVQYIDVRDVAEWMIRLIENKNTGTYNATGPKDPQGMYEFVNQASLAFDKKLNFVYIDDYDFLKENDIHYIVPWIMPIENNLGSAYSNNILALRNGLHYRPLQQSIQDTYNWWYSDAVSQEQRDAMEKDPKSILNREASIIKKWKSL